MTIPIQWTANIANDPKAKEAFENTLVHDSTILHRLKEILYERECSLTNTLFSLSTPKDHQDNLIGRIAELREINKLLNI